MKYFRVMLLMLALIAGMRMEAQNPDSIENPNLMNMYNFVYDPDGLLSKSTKNTINSRLYTLRKQTTCEVAVAIVDNLDGLSAEDYSYRLFRHWGLGKRDNNNGVLFMICPSEKKVRIEVGSGAEGVLTDISCSKIIRSKVIPAMKDGNLSQAVYGAMNEIAGALMDPSVAEELRSRESDSTMERIKSLDSDTIKRFFLMVVGCVFLFTLAMFISDFVNTRRRDNYRRAMTWRNHMNTYWWCSLLSLGTTLPLALLAYALYRRARDVEEICDTCGAKMEKLSEEEDNNYLSSSQDFEERLGTVDYDVWKCPKCGTVERFPYVERQLKYQKCPECNTIAMNLVMDKVVDPPTTSRPGHGERIYRCQYCKHMRRDGYTIPKKMDNSAATAAILGAAVGSAFGRGGGGGGSIGGGFGGGHSSGGGASGSW